MTNTFLAETNKGFSGKFKDKHAEKNAGEIMHMVRRNDVYANIGWMTDLRGDRAAKKPPQSNTTTKKIRKINYDLWKWMVKNKKPTFFSNSFYK